ncbi:ABC transporter ATP-binding protein [Aurantimonas sp. E1-2-R+4]|uniref:ABC transporter ATP-binding protein n=1 Tax=Aurantimonas sp. E1-2-R+4 TaxID=3113714 RepID=UPI002F9224BA
MDAFIRFENISKAFGAQTVVDNLDLTIRRGEFLSLLGPSGSGKTTILMMLAGFVAPTQGRIRLDGREIQGVPAHKRDLGVVFQSYALFPHMTVSENVAFPLRMRGVRKAEISERVTRSLDMVQLGKLGARRPAQLSGGQQQRVALARAMVYEPKVVLMDEPLGALDKQLREQMQLELRDLHRSLGLTIVFVTHDQSEALTMSDRIAVFESGRIEQIGPPEEIYDRPRTRFVAEFIGETNVLEGTVVSLEKGVARLAAGGGRTLLARTDRDLAAGQRLLVCVRPERIAVSDDPGAANAIPVEVADSVYQGDHIRLRLEGDGVSLVGRRDRSRADVPTGTRGYASFAPGDCALVDA